MKKSVFFSLVFCSFFVFGFSQNRNINSVEGEALWLQGSYDGTLKEVTNSDQYFNFNPIFSSVDSKALVHKNILKSKYSLFVVFKSEVEEEVSIINLKSNNVTTQITNKQLINTQNNTYRKVNSQKGIVLTYLVSHQEKGRRKSNLSIENLTRPNTEKGYRNDLMELIYYPRVLTNEEKQKVETYLSIKYGISLIGKVDYVNSESKKVWDSKENKSYNNRVTGVGKDRLLHLDQKQSGNAEQDGLYIGFGDIAINNSKNTSDLADKSFLLWGDNNGEKVIKADKNALNDIKKMKRVWKMQSTEENQSLALSTQVIIEKDAFSIEEDKKNKEDDFVWLVIDRNSTAVFDYQNAEYYLQSKDENGKIFFDNVIWDADKNGSDTFTFVKGPDFFVEYEIANLDCSLTTTGEARLKIVGGKSPFKLDFKAPAFAESYMIEERSFKLSDLVPKNYTISVTDKMLRRQEDTLKMYPFKNVSVALVPRWYLDGSKEVLVVPQIENPDNEELQFVWKQDEKILSREKQFRATEEGDYKLIVTNESGCENESLFKVNKSSELTNNGWMMYPNPVKMDEPFTIKFDLEKESEVAVTIYDFANKLIRNKHLGMIKQFEYSEILSSIGTFLVVVTTDGKAASAKIIIK